MTTHPIPGLSRRTSLAGLFSAVLLFAAPGADARTWTSADGSQTFEGELVSYDPENDAVRVTMTNGRTITFKQEVLSEADIEYLKSEGIRAGAGAGAANIGELPDELPDPDGEPADMSQPVQVFILLGQSNMLGFGKISGGGDGSLEHAVNSKDLYPYLVDDEGNWTARKDVRNVRVMQQGGGMKLFNNEWMTITGGKIGPEIGIGHHVGYVVDAPVMILKSCIGNRSLGWDLLPPGVEAYEHDGKLNAGYGETPETAGSGEKHSGSGWYAGKQYDDDIANAKKVLDDLEPYYPDADDYEVAGFFWWQGDKDRYNAAHAERYETHLVRLIKQLREDFDAPDAKFVCATLGQTRKGAGGKEGAILEGTLAVDGETGDYPEFEGNVASVYSHPLSRGGASNGHYGGHAETYMNIGEAMGKAMVELLRND